MSEQPPEDQPYDFESDPYFQAGEAFHHLDETVDRYMKDPADATPEELDEARRRFAEALRKRDEQEPPL